MDIVGWFSESFFPLLSNILYMPFKYILDGIILIFGTIINITLQGFFDILLALISVIDISSVVQNFILQMTGMPPQMIYLINAANLPTAITCILSAYGIRFLLNLIPAAFTRI